MSLYFSLHSFRTLPLPKCFTAEESMLINTRLRPLYLYNIKSSVPHRVRLYRFNRTWWPKKEDIESHKIDKLYEFSNDSSNDSKF